MLQEKILELLRGLPDELVVMIISMIPVIEVRGAIPIAMTLYKMQPLYAAIISVFASMLPVPIILLAITKVLAYLKTTKMFHKLAVKLESKSGSKRAESIHKYGALGLIVFVGIPLPGTGVWSGSLIAALLGIKFKWAFLAVLAGDILAATIVTLISSGLIHIF
ncbi:MAG: small multi-drug export protein [Saccharofermentanales bacterium]